MKIKTQAGLEYLLTYGWALVLIVTLVGAVVFVMGTPTGETTFYSLDPTKIMLKSGTLTDGTAEIKLQNATGGQITITNFSGMGNDCEINGQGEGEIRITAGGEISIVCQNVSNEELAQGLEIAYENYAGLQKTVAITATEPTATPGRIDLALGEACTAASECQSGFCEDNVCCETECGGECQFCNATGTCVNRSEGDSTECSACFSCQGGSCQANVGLLEGAAATALGCETGSQECRYCDNGTCGFYPSGKHGCSGTCQGCNASGNCAACVGAEMVTDPDFDNPGAWVTGDNWWISNGLALYSTNESGHNDLEQDGIPFQAGKSYRAITVVDYFSAEDPDTSLKVCIPEPAGCGALIKNEGTYTQYITASAAMNLLELEAESFEASGFDIEIESISVKECTC